MHSLSMDTNGMVYLPIDSTIMENPFIYKLVPCQHFLQGVCNKTDATCPFSHGSMLPLPTYAQPQSYWYNVTLNPNTSTWTLESIPDHSQPPAIRMATGLPLINATPQHVPSSFQFSTHHQAISGTVPVSYPPVGRQRGKTSSYQGRARTRYPVATNQQHSSSGKRRGKRHLGNRQGNPSSHVTANSSKSKPTLVTQPGSASLVESFDSMKIQSGDSDVSSVSSWASLSTKASTSKSLPAFSQTNFPDLPTSNNADRRLHGSERSRLSSEATSVQETSRPRGAWALGGPQNRLSTNATSSGTKSMEMSGTVKRN